MDSQVAQTLSVDSSREIERICAWMRASLQEIHRKGAVVAISGGIDSSLTAALAVRALGPERVVGLILPERDSSEDAETLARVLAEQLGIQTVRHDITGALEALGCYRGLGEAFRQVIPEYGKGWKTKLTLSPIREEATLRHFSLIAQAPDGTEVKKRLAAEQYLEILASSNFKQRVRKMLEYHHADRLNFAVLGTPNRLEYELGFFVKFGDGAADLKPIAHLYKSQVYQLADVLGLPEEILARSPTTDLYTLEQSQEECFFSLPYELMDICLWGKNAGMTAEEVSALSGLSGKLACRVFEDIDQKRRSTRYLHLEPQLVEPVLPPERPPDHKEIGVDAVSIERMEQDVARWGRTFLCHLFTEREIAYCQAKYRPATHYAATFAAKEAVFKALRLDGSSQFNWKLIEVVRDEHGAPGVVLAEELAKAVLNDAARDVRISITHTETNAVAVAFVCSEAPSETHTATRTFRVSRRCGTTIWT
jgi:NAD+ synthase